METKFKTWMLEHALPLWARAGLDDSDRGGFYESLNFSGEPEGLPRRALVQARQIFSFRTALELKAIDAAMATKAIHSGLQYLMQKYSLPSNAFSHSVTMEGKPVNAIPELYTQAFALFGMANAYAVQPHPATKARAKALLQYLNSERKLADGGFAELINDQIAYEANPHMHLFEAAIYWMEVDPDPEWRTLADSILELCLSRFIDPTTGFLAEHFDEKWQPLKVEGRFVFEPGHQYEWAWLMGRYEKITKRDLLSARTKLFDLSEQFGILASRKAVIDEAWSDGLPKLKTSRFWPQCERIKAAMQLARDPRITNSAKYTLAAYQSVETLMKFFDTPRMGLWYDTWTDSGEFKASSAKASSLYHIIGAYAEFTNPL